MHGEYPRVTSSCAGPTEQPVLHERYRGAVEVVRSPSGSLFVIGELRFEDYLKGIAEVPRDWPIEALKAQVVAARTYALSRLDPGGEYDLCVTDECQVYRGMGIEAGAWGERWVRAVEETAGEALRYQGEPASTYYFSTSNGRTYDVEDVFGGTALPYLRGVPERDDRGSPVARWAATFPFGYLARFLAATGHPTGTIRGVTQRGNTIVVTGGRRVELSREAFRDSMNSVAACLEPSSYPTREPGGYRLPQAVPSRWYRARQAGAAVVLRGRGWGHGVGMVQWGAEGKARRGLAYDEILAAYYGGLRPEPGDVPRTIRILIAEELTSVTVEPSGDGASPETPRPPWRIAPTAGGVSVRHGTPPRPVLEPLGFEAARVGTPGLRYEATVRLPESARVRLEVVDGGEVVAETAWGSFDEGIVRLSEPFPDVPEGAYELRALVTDGVDTVRTRATPIRVRPAASPTPSPSPSMPPAAAPPADTGLPVPLVVGAAVALSLALLLFVLTLRSRTRFHRR